MKTIIGVFLFICYVTTSSAQNITNIAEYKFNFRGVSQLSKLFYNDIISMSVHNTIDTTFKSDALKDPFTLEDKFKDNIGDIYYKDLKNGILKGREIVLNRAFLYEEPLPVMRWNLKSDQKKIGKLSCQKATLTFRGRNYEAWFTNDIPISTGPWKFHGLPGLIVEIKDSRNDISFVIKRILQTTNSKINFPEKGEKISFEEYKNIWFKTMDDHRKKVLSMINDKDVTIEVELKHDKLMEINFENE